MSMPTRADERVYGVYQALGINWQQRAKHSHRRNKQDFVFHLHCRLRFERSDCSFDNLDSRVVYVEN